MFRTKQWERLLIVNTPLGHGRVSGLWGGDMGHRRRRVCNVQPSFTEHTLGLSTLCVYNDETVTHRASWDRGRLIVEVNLPSVYIL